MSNNMLGFTSESLLNRVHWGSPKGQSISARIYVTN